MIKTCLQCDQEFKTYRSTAMYCNKKCADAAMKKRVLLTCSYCGKKFERIPSRIKGKDDHFCSPKCQRAWVRALPKTKRCQWCGKNFKASPSNRAMFCSKRCWYDYKSKSVEVKCDWCGQIMIVPPSKLKANEHFYCSRECWRESTKGEGNPSWCGGHSKYKGPNWERQSLKCRKRDQYTCQSCNASGLEISLHAHHRTPYRYFNGDWRTANRLSNLITLCISCHMKIDTAIIFNRIDTIPENCRPLKIHQGLMGI